MNITDGVGPVRYPQPPETITTDEIVVAYQFSEKTPDGLLIYHIRAARIALAARPD